MPHREQCISVTDVKQEGLFRKAGNVDRQRVLCDHLNGATMQLNLREFTVHDCATVLKSFLGEMPEPLLIEKYCTAYRQVAGLRDRYIVCTKITLLCCLILFLSVVCMEQITDKLWKHFGEFFGW